MRHTFYIYFLFPSNNLKYDIAGQFGLLSSKMYIPNVNGNISIRYYLGFTDLTTFPEPDFLLCVVFHINDI